MCGISIVISKSSNVNNLNNRLVSMTDIIRHRGPDDEGYLVVDRWNNCYSYGGNDTKYFINKYKLDYLPTEKIQNYKTDNKIKIAFGFRRLSIIDLTPTGHQPMSYMNGRYWIVFNGEIYNYIELRNELKDLGYRFHSNTDTEVIMAAYDYYGVDCFNKFNGMWAFVLYDLKNDEIIVSRDRFGIKPLYYYNDNNYLLFASEIKQFISFGGLDIQPYVEKIINDLNVDTREYLKETPFTNVFRFPKSHYLKTKVDSLNNKDIIFKQYYKLNYLIDDNRIEYDRNTAHNLAEEYYSLLEDSVSLRLRADVDVGTCFSGGLDSSSVVYLVNKLIQKKNISSQQKTFSLVFNSTDTKYCDESFFIDKLSKELNLKSYKTEPSVEDVLGNIRKMIFAMDTPQHSTLMSYIFTYQLVRQNGIVVTLDGQGADELQAGYLPYFRYYSINNSIFEALKKLSSNMSTMKGANKEIMLGVIFSVIKRLRLNSAAERYIRNKNKQTPFKTLNEKLFEDFNNNLETLFHYGDRGSMINSVEARFPMMDYRLVEFWMRMPSIYKLFDGYTKYIARISMNKKLPDDIVWRKDKKGWEMPQKEWVKNGLGVLIRDEVSNSRFLKEIGIDFNFSKFDMSISDNRHWKLPIRLYNLSQWYKIFFEESGKYE